MKTNLSEYIEQSKLISNSQPLYSIGQLRSMTEIGDGGLGTGDGGQGTGNREQGTGNREQGTGNGEQGTGNRERGTGKGKTIPRPPTPDPRPPDPVPQTETSGANINSIKPKFLSTLKGKLIMTTLCLTIGAAIIAMLMQISDLKMGINNQNTHTNNASNLASTQATTQEVNTNSTVINNNNETQNYEYKGIPILRLTDVELEKLGIFKKDNGYEFKVQSFVYWNDDYTRERVAPYGYDTSLSYFTYRSDAKIEMFYFKDYIIKYNNWGMTSCEKTYPVACDSYRKFASGGNGTGSTSYGFSPLLDSNLIFKYFREKDVVLIDFKQSGLPEGNNFIKADKSALPFITQLVTVYIKLGDPKSNGSDNLLWYMPNKEFIALLPVRYQEMIRKNMPAIDANPKGEINKILQANAKTNEKNNSQNIANKPKEENTSGKQKSILNNEKVILKNLQGINAITLPDEYLEKLSIKKEGDSIVFYREQILNIDSYKKRFALLFKGVNPLLDKIRMNFKNRITYNSIGNPEDETPEWNTDLTTPLKTSPIGATAQSWRFRKNNWRKEASLGYLGDYSEIIAGNVDHNLLSKLLFTHSELMDSSGNNSDLITKRLVPVYVRLGDKIEKENTKYTDIIFWFVPTDDFLNIIPEKISRQIRTELDIIERLENGTIDQTEACQALKGHESYFDICRMDSKVIEDVSIMPNPISGGAANLKFTLAKNSKLAINLYDISGNLVQKISSAEFSKGENTTPIELKSDVSQGIYLLSIEDEAGNHVVKRIVVQ
ncbi:MAG: hypothetical protein HW421_1119 [Ignavibacteria bacterium]|nr:hypothetical protein [Ignavibacteria bacterium]